jgi:hypothetical protein
VHTLPLSHADLSQKHMVDRIIKYFLGWRNDVLEKEKADGIGESLLDDICVWFTSLSCARTHTQLSLSLSLSRVQSRLTSTISAVLT